MVRRYSVLLLLLIASQPLLSAAEHPGDTKLVCETVEEANKNIRCTYHCQRVAHDRNVTFIWRSSLTPQDDRQRTIVLKAHHGSLYDYRFYYGRATGSWEVSVEDDAGSSLATTSFIIE